MSVWIEREGDGVVLRASMVLKERVKQIPGARHDSKAQVWRAPLTWATCVVARGVFGSDLEVGPELARWATEELETRVNPAMEAREAKE